MGKIKILTNDIIKERLKKLNLDKEYTYINSFNSKNGKRLNLIHNICGTEFSVLPANFFKGVGFCPNCAIEKRKKTMTKTNEEFLNEIQIYGNNEYQLLDLYNGANRKIKFLHKNCNKEFMMTPSNFLQGQRCPHCFSSESKRYTTNEVQEIINKKLGKDYILKSTDYKNNHTPILVFHEKCKNTWKTTLRGVNAGNRCPFCTVMTKGEERIFNFLTNNNINAIYQYSTIECKRKEVLPFDFFIENKNILIEYDGIFHYKPIYGEENLRIQQENDEIKNKYARDNNIKLLRIAYYDFDKIEEILKENLF